MATNLNSGFAVGGFVFAPSVSCHVELTDRPQGVTLDIWCPKTALPSQEAMFHSFTHMPRPQRGSGIRSRCSLDQQKPSQRLSSDTRHGNLTSQAVPQVVLKGMHWPSTMPISSMVLLQDAPATGTPTSSFLFCGTAFMHRSLVHFWPRTYSHLQGMQHWRSVTTSMA